MIACLNQTPFSCMMNNNNIILIFNYSSVKLGTLGEKPSLESETEMKTWSSNVHDKKAHHNESLYFYETWLQAQPVNTNYEN